MGIAHKSILLGRRTAFLLCDVQEAFRPVVPRLSEVIDTSNRLLNAARILDIPVVATEQYPKGLGRTCSELMAEERSSGGRFQMFEKTQFSMLTDPVRAELTAHSIEAVVLFGLETHVCILQTALDAIAMGLGVWIPMDGVAARFPLDHEAALGQLRLEQGVKLSSSESILFQMLGDAKHPNFKAISALCKQTR